VLPPALLRSVSNEGLARLWLSECRIVLLTAAARSPVAVSSGLRKALRALDHTSLQRTFSRNVDSRQTS